MSVTPIRPDQDDDELFEPFLVWVIPEVYHRPSDFWQDLVVEAGWNVASGETVRMEHREFTLAEAEHLVEVLGAAIAYLRDGRRG
jgi:hypothetical protein